jgi:hypothetical protein
MSTKATATKNSVTPEQIKEWKQKYGKVVELRYPIDEDDISEDAEHATFYVVPPSRNVLNAASANVDKKEYEKGNQILIKSCVVGGDLDLISNDAASTDNEIYYSLLEEIGKLVKGKRVVVKKH